MAWTDLAQDVSLLLWASAIRFFSPLVPLDNNLNKLYLHQTDTHIGSPKMGMFFLAGTSFGGFPSWSLPGAPWKRIREKERVGLESMAEPGRRNGFGNSKGCSDFELFANEVFFGFSE